MPLSFLRDTQLREAMGDTPPPLRGLVRVESQLGSPKFLETAGIRSESDPERLRVNSGALIETPTAGTRLLVTRTIATPDGIVTVSQPFIVIEEEAVLEAPDKPPLTLEEQFPGLSPEQVAALLGQPIITTGQPPDPVPDPIVLPESQPVGLGGPPPDTGPIAQPPDALPPEEIPPSGCETTVEVGFDEFGNPIEIFLHADGDGILSVIIP